MAQQLGPGPLAASVSLAASAGASCFLSSLQSSEQLLPENCQVPPWTDVSKAQTFFSSLSQTHHTSKCFPAQKCALTIALLRFLIIVLMFSHLEGIAGREETGLPGVDRFWENANKSPFFECTFQGQTSQPRALSLDIFPGHPFPTHLGQVSDNKQTLHTLQLNLLDDSS